ncbi:MAG: hypothetical protein NTU47_14900 [Ignavibacteriales bacterium]|nr:hypothetical protein [Ignavibacteriales bacterium]
MTAGALFWLILFGIAALVFFGIAVVVTIRGVGDLRHLLKSTVRRIKQR